MPKFPWARCSASNPWPLLGAVLYFQLMIQEINFFFFNSPDSGWCWLTALTNWEIPCYHHFSQLSFCFCCLLGAGSDTSPLCQEAEHKEQRQPQSNKNILACNPVPVWKCSYKWFRNVLSIKLPLQISGLKHSHVVQDLTWPILTVLEGNFGTILCFKKISSSRGAALWHLVQLHERICRIGC